MPQALPKLNSGSTTRLISRHAFYRAHYFDIAHSFGHPWTHRVGGVSQHATHVVWTCALQCHEVDMESGEHCAVGLDHCLLFSLVTLARIQPGMALVDTCGAHFAACSQVGVVHGGAGRRAPVFLAVVVDLYRGQTRRAKADVHYDRGASLGRIALGGICPWHDVGQARLSCSAL